MSGDKTEQPTAQKLKKAKQEGQIGRSQDVGAWFGMLAASIMLPRTLGSAMDHARELMAKVPDVIANPDPALAMDILKDGDDERVLGGAAAGADDDGRSASRRPAPRAASGSPPSCSSRSSSG